MGRFTKENTPALAAIGRATQSRWTKEKRKQLGERNRWFFREWWKKHPEHRATITRVLRPTSIEMMARESLGRRGIRFEVCRKLEDICYPDLILPSERIAIFCNGCFWHACPIHCSEVPSWLRAKIKDKEVREALESKGWRVLEVWEHEFKLNKDAAGLRLDAIMKELPR